MSFVSTRFALFFPFLFLVYRGSSPWVGAGSPTDEANPFLYFQF